MRETPPHDSGGGSRRAVLPQGASLDNAAERELRELLKVVRPEWSLIPRRGGGAPIDRVMAKLKDIGVCDVTELVRRVRANTINMELTAAGHTNFGEDTIASIRKTACFLRALEHLGSAVHYRQTGPFAPVPQLLAKTNLFFEAATKEALLSEAALQKPQQRPSTAPNQHTGKRTAGSHRNGDAFQRSMSGVAGTGNNPAGVVGVGASSVLAACRPSSAPGGITRVKTGQQTPPFGSKPRPSAVRSSSVASAGVSRGRGVAEDETMLIGERPALRYASLTRPRSSPAGMRGISSTGNKRSHSRNSGGTNSAAQDEGGICVSRSPRSNGDCSSPKLAKAPEFETESSSADAGAEEAAEMQQLQQLQHAGFGSHSESCSVANWKSVGRSGIEIQVKSMLAEQRALDEKDKFFQAIAREGKTSGIRKVVTDNIRCRLQQETESNRDAKMVAVAHQQCFNIRNKLASLKETRRELTSIRKRAQAVIEEPHAEIFEGMKARFTEARVV